MMLDALPISRKELEAGLMNHGVLPAEWRGDDEFASLTLEDVRKEIEIIRHNGRTSLSEGTSLDGIRKNAAIFNTTIIQ